MSRYHWRRITKRMRSRLVLLIPRLARLLPATPTFRRHEYHWENGSEKFAVLLPGIDDIPEDFSRRGVIAGIKRHDIAAGAVAVDAHLGYYIGRSLHETLADDVIRPARQRGYRHFLLAGISLGGFGAVSYAEQFPDDVAALLLLAPYLGNRSLIREIAAAGGVRTWNPGQVDRHDHERRLWAWIKREYSDGNRHSIPLYLGYGKGDWMVDAHQLLAAVIPRERLFVIPGGHNWKTWSALWPRLLARLGAETDAGRAMV